MKANQRKLTAVCWLLAAALAIGAAMWLRYRAVGQFESNRALLVAIDRNDVASVRRLLRRGASPNARPIDTTTEPGWSAFLPGHGGSNSSTVHGPTALLLAMGSPRQSMRGDAPFLYPVGKSMDPTVVKALMDRGADINARSDDGETPLFFAVGTRNAPMTEMLIARNAEVDARNRQGDTPLFVAARCGATELIPVLLSHGANIDAQNGVRETPLIAAVRTPHPDTIKLLLEHKPELTLRTMAGETALARARRIGDARTVDLLRRAGATN